ncbi:MAG: hypothetical protein ABSC11_07595 [Smithella sp.]|jgi:hypothetical protein
MKTTVITVMTFLVLTFYFNVCLAGSATDFADCKNNCKQCRVGCHDFCSDKSKKLKKTKCDNNCEKKYLKCRQTCREI